METERGGEDGEKQQLRTRKTRRRNLLVVQLHDGLLQVADPAVDQLGAPAARPRGEIAALHEGGLKVWSKNDKIRSQYMCY